MMRSFTSVARAAASAVHTPLMLSARLARVSALLRAPRSPTFCSSPSRPRRHLCARADPPLTTIFSLQTCVRYASTNAAGAAPTSSNIEDQSHKSNGNKENSDESSSSQRQGQEKASSSTSSFSSTFQAYRAFRQDRHNRQSHQYQTLSMYLDRLPPGLRELLLYSPLLALLYFVLVQARVYYLDEDEPWYHILMPQRWRYAAPTAHVSSLLQHAPMSEPCLRSSLEPLSMNVLMNVNQAAKEVDCTNDGFSADVEVCHTDTPSDGNIGNNDTSSGAATSSTSKRGFFCKTVEEVDASFKFELATAYRYRADGVQDAAATPGGAAPPLVPPFHESVVRRTEAEHVVMTASSTADAKREQLEGKKVEDTQKAEKAAEALALRYPYGVWAGPLQVLRDPTTNRVMGYSTDATA